MSGILFLTVTSLCFAPKPGPMRQLSRLPAAVQQTIRAQLEDSKLNSIEKDDDGAYDVEMTRGGKARDFTVGADGELIDMQVFISELPATAQKAIQSQTGKGTLGDIYKSVDDDGTSYDVEIINDGKERDFTFADDGRLLSAEMFLTELPLPVQQTIQKKTAGATLDEIDKSFEDVDANYEVEMTRDGKTRDFDVGTNGDLLDEQVFLSELPDALQKAIQKEASDAKVGDIYKSVDDDGTSYDVDMTKGTTTRTVTFGADGKIWSREQPVNLADVPDAAQKTMKSLDGKILDISKVTEDGDISYDVDLASAGKLKTVSVGEDGKILPDDN
ncbi:MAG TPA: PepSY-like domain-containing protein [Verrucomicrobiae bacterium]|nr:PepSY-like domain-containing protein [Verrucomicrobiae bacterium]